MERSRITPRLRPRPYDLRRKVLLKNFFREQLTHIPTISINAEVSLDVNNDSDVDENELNSNTNEGNILTPKNVEENIVNSKPVPEPSPSTSNCNEKENSNNPESSSVNEASSNISEMEARPSSKFSRFSRIIETIDSRLSAKKNRRKGIKKAKHELRASKGLLKPAGKKIIKDTESSTKVKSRSLFERFKSRRDKKRNKFPTSKITNLFSSRNPSPTKSNPKVVTTTTQSVQTDASWSLEQYEKMEQSNRSLLEENRLLSQSISNMITNVNYRSSDGENSYTNTSNNSPVYYSAEPSPINKRASNTSHSQPFDSTRNRILRTRSMQDRSDKRNLQPTRLRTRSFTSRSTKRPYDTGSFASTEPHFSNQSLHRAHPIASPVPSRANTRLSALQNIHSPPLRNINPTPLLRTFTSKSSKAIVRRSSMPERTYNWSYKARPVRSSSMRENTRFSYSSERFSPRPTHSSRRRSSTFNGCSTVPFRDLPPGAFY